MEFFSRPPFQWCKCLLWLPCALYVHSFGSKYSRRQPASHQWLFKTMYPSTIRQNGGGPSYNYFVTLLLNLLLFLVTSNGYVTFENRGTCYRNETVTNNIKQRQRLASLLPIITALHAIALVIITERCDNVSLEPRAITLKSDNNFDMSIALTIKSDSFSPQC